MKKGVFFLLFIAWAFSGTAQRTVTLSKENIPRIPLDTLTTEREDVKAVVYSDNTFRYIHTCPEEYKAKEAFCSHWDTVTIFAYRDVELSSLPTSLELNLISEYGEYHYPATGRILSKYGPRGRRNHNGIDMKVEHGDPIYATFDGIVRYSKWNTGGFGNLVIVRHANGLETYYGHLSRRNVHSGDFVKAGQVIGYGGSTGRSRGTHLHFEMRYCDQTFDPEHIIDFETGHLRYQTFALEKSYFNIRSRAFEGLEEDDDLNMALLLANGGDDIESISDGIVESIEKKEREEAAAAAAKYHTIRSGDTLGRIAINYKTTIADICKLNNIQRSTTLKIGRKLRVQ